MRPVAEFHDRLREVVGASCDEALLLRALTHRSYSFEHDGQPHNERLEFLGDAVLGIVVTDTLYRTHPDLTEGQLAKLRAAVVNSRALAEVARVIDLGSFVLLGKGEEATGGRDKDSILADTTEAVIGCVYVSCDLEAAATFVHHLLDPLLERSADLGAGLDWKTSLQEVTATAGLGPPEYQLEAEGPDHDKRFTASAVVGDEIVGTGRGRSKKLAEQRAAEAAWQLLTERAAEVAGVEPTVAAPGPLPLNGTRTTGPQDRARVSELPEVEVVRRGLADHVVGRTISSAELSGPRVARRHPAGPVDLAARVEGARVLAADRRGKYLWLVLEPPGDDAQALVIHLGMSGQLLVEDAAAPPEKHLHARVDFVDEGPQLRFVDQRTFGGLALAPLHPDPRAGDGAGDHAHGIPEPVLHLAADPLEAAFDRAAVVARMKGKDVALKRVLLDQGVVSGVGNIYADEALWRAQVHGRRAASALTRPALGRVLDHAADVMREALGQGGTSFDALYVNVNGASGYFDRSLAAYGQTGRPCPRCGTPIRREEFMNRSSHFCPRCQVRPRLPR